MLYTTSFLIVPTYSMATFTATTRSDTTGKRPSPIYIPHSTGTRLWRNSVDFLTDDQGDCGRSSAGASIHYHKSPLGIATMTTRTQGVRCETLAMPRMRAIPIEGTSPGVSEPRWKKMLKKIFPRKNEPQGDLEVIVCHDWMEI